MTLPSEIPIRQNGDVADASWWNIIRDALLNVSGASSFSVTDFDMFAAGVSADITGATFDSADSKFVVIDYYASITDSVSGDLKAIGKLNLVYDDDASAWVIVNDERNESGGAATEFTFSVDTTSGVGQLVQDQDLGETAFTAATISLLGFNKP